MPCNTNGMNATAQKQPKSALLVKRKPMSETFQVLDLTDVNIGKPVKKFSAPA